MLNMRNHRKGGGRWRHYQMFVLRNNAFNVIYKIQTTINQTGRKNFILPPPPPPYPFFHLSPFAARAYVVEAPDGGCF
jgi:hypothetical protein